MKRSTIALLSCLAAAATAAGCGGSSSTSTDGGTDGAGVVGFALTQPCTDKIDDVYTPPTGLPAFDASHRGDVVRCAKDVHLDAAQLNAAITADGYTGAKLPTGVQVYRVAYRTQRVANAKGPGDSLSSALLFVPDQPIAPGALVVTAHGTTGNAPACAPSRDDIASTTADAHTLNLAFAGRGLLTIAPDYAGLGYTGGVYGWTLAEDESHSLLDATRAVKRLVPAQYAPQKVVITGHSQGGHAVLATQGLAAGYGLEGSLVGVIGFAPFWLTGRTWGAALSPIANLNTDANSGVLGYQMLYFYSHGELYDGAGGGVAMFRPEKRDAVKAAMTQSCDLAASVKGLGKTPPDYIDPDFATTVGNCALGGMCDSDAAKLWRPRFKVDRPALDKAGAPVLVWQGGADGTVTPSFAECGFEKMAADVGTGNPATLTLCGDKDATHGSVVERNTDWAGQWALARLGAGPEPAACPAISSLGTLTCPSLPPNDD